MTTFEAFLNYYVIYFYIFTYFLNLKTSCYTGFLAHVSCLNLKTKKEINKWPKKKQNTWVDQYAIRPISSRLICALFSLHPSYIIWIYKNTWPIQNLSDIILTSRKHTCQGYIRSTRSYNIMSKYCRRILLYVLLNMHTCSMLK